jgi:hypothetical protein
MPNISGINLRRENMFKEIKERQYKNEVYIQENIHLLLDPCFVSYVKAHEDRAELIGLVEEMKSWIKIGFCDACGKGCEKDKYCDIEILLKKLE